MGDIDSSEKEVFFVAVKIFLEKGNQLLILKDKFGEWDLPGGRIKKHEFETPMSDIIARKMREEVGSDLKYTVHDTPSVLMRHERVESSPGNPTVRIFGLGYRATLLGGEPALSEMHTDMKWVDVDAFEPEKYFTGGWLKGLQEYLVLRKRG